MVLTAFLGFFAGGCRKGPSVADEVAYLEARHDAGEYPPLYKACQEGRLDLVKGLFEKGYGSHSGLEKESGEYPIHAAAGSGQAELVCLLLERGAEVEADDGKGGRPLHRAAEGGHVEAARILLAAGARIDREDRYGYQPIHCAASGGSVEMVGLLKDAGAALDSKAGPEKPMRSNELERDPAISASFLRAGINPVDGKQPIHVAARRGQVAVVAYLLEQGVSPDAPDNNKRTPKDYAEQEGPLEGGRLEVVELLRRNTSHSP
jgi:ankyrin repeat protein